MEKHIEEGALKWFVGANKHEIIFDLGWMRIFEAGAKYQESKMYSEEEVLKLLRESHFVEENIEDWFNKNKKN